MKSREASPFRSLVVVLFLGIVQGCAPESPAARTPPSYPQVARSSEGVVSAAQPLAAEAGAEILLAGGNAADAAVAAAFAVSVVEPSMNSIGGRAQILLRRPDGSFRGIDATTQAPASYDPETAPQASYGYPTVGVPGALAGLALLLEEEGTMTLSQVMEPAIRLAREGFELLPGEAARHGAGAQQLREFDGSRASYLDESGEARSAGALFRQPELAQTLQLIAEQGPDVFYRGEIAEMIAADVQARGGAVTRESLAAYRALDAKVVRGSYRGLELVGTDLPASGAVTIGILHVLERFDVASLDREDWAALVGAVAGRVFAERAEARSGQSGAAGLEFMTDKDWAGRIAAEIELPGLRRAASLEPGTRRRRGAVSGDATPVQPAAGRSDTDWTGDAWGPLSDHTTHLSTGDGEGMYVALTQTIGPNLGSKVATPGLGFLYAATLGGYLGPMEPGARAASSISPLMVVRDGEPILVLGAAGGIRIISAVVQAVLRVVDQGMSLPDALAAARVHPTENGIAMETSPEIGWTDEDVREVEALGINVETVGRAGAFGRIHAIWIDPETGESVGVADADWEGAAVAPAMLSGRKDEAAGQR